MFAVKSGFYLHAVHQGWRRVFTLRPVGRLASHLIEMVGYVTRARDSDACSKSLSEECKDECLEAESHPSGFKVIQLMPTSTSR